MVKTIDDLVKYCMQDKMPTMPVIADYFGLDNVAHLSIILGLYQGMIKIKGMDKAIIEKAYKKNELDKLIHDSYEIYGTSGYYKMFCDQNIILKQALTRRDALLRRLQAIVYGVPGKTAAVKAPAKRSITTFFGGATAKGAPTTAPAAPAPEEAAEVERIEPPVKKAKGAVVSVGAPVPLAPTTALTMAERVSLVKAQLGLDEGLPVAKAVAAANEAIGIEGEGPLAAQVARLLVELGIDAESRAVPHLSVVTEAATEPAPSTGAKPDKTADGAVADAADDVADDAADEACGKKGVVLGGDESMPLARRLMLGRLEATLGAAGLASPVGGPDSPATPATTAAGMGDNDGAAARNDSDDSGGAVGRAKMVAAEAPDEEPPAKRAAVAEGSEAKPASKAKALAPTKAVGAAAAAKSKAVSKAVAAGKGKGDAHSNAGAKAAATAAPVPKTAPGVAAPKQAGLLGFLVRPKPSTEPAAPPAAAVGGAE